ncbi:MAG TPA: superoxide dismutase family protein [Usitatibacter sp.]|jgi:Cu-Zn family superoxide dismutase|nr:superoxide dismutase family protein [Usitatibacter sp.]
MKAIFLVPAALLAGCASMHMGSHASAVASLEPASGSNVRGSVTFTQDGDEVRVRANVSGLPPNSEHGFHIHDKGDCSSGDGMSTGGHFNPTAKPHGPQSGEHHAGDMPSLAADAYGNASASFELKGVKVGGGGPTDLVGHGLIVHKDPDDFRTQPTGNAGARVACGVIRST